MFSIFDTIALLVGLIAAFGWVNTRYTRLPPAVCFLLAGMLVSVLLVAADVMLPGGDLHQEIAAAVMQLDFTKLVMNGMLAFLLFAGALEVDLGKLRERATPVALLALIGTSVSVVLVGAGFWFAARLLNQPLAFEWALVFGALISPTDPVAVLSTLKHVKVPKNLQVEVQGESLFNDGIGVILFTILLSHALGGGGEVEKGGLVHVAVQEIGGGLAFGLVAGFVAYRAMKAIDDFAVEVLITLALVTVTYAMAQHFGVSGPLAVVAAGLLMGWRGPRYAMSTRSERYVTGLWILLNEILNALLFLLIGLELVVLRLGLKDLLLPMMAIPIVLLARLISVSIPLIIPSLRSMLSVRNVPFLTWAGVRGGISIALVLALPSTDAKPLLVASTYGVVLFSILVQATTLDRVARRTFGRNC